MKTSKTLLSFLFIGVIASSCSKDKDHTAQTEPGTGNLEDMVISESFNWSSSFKGNVEITIDAPQYLTTEGQPVEIVDAEGLLLETGIVHNSSASFYITQPQLDSKIYVHYPNTQEQAEITSANTVLKLQDISLNGLSSNLFNTEKKGGTVKGKTLGTNMVEAGDFESATFLMDSSVYTSLRITGDWFARDNYGTVANVGGSKVFKSANPTRNADILQSFAVDGDEIFDFNYDYNGNGGFYVLFFNASKSFIGYTTVYTNGSQGHANFLTSKTVKYLQIYGFCNSNGWLDNVNLIEVIEPDDDNDGVSNRQDAYPNDPNRAYASFFPTLGRQTLAFEDLWPSSGDFDFNDLVISNRVEFRKDANNNLVDAVVKVKVLGLGAGLSSGLAIQLLKSDKQPFSNNIISTVSGGSAMADPDVANGVIVFNDDRKALSPFYNNNGFGPSGTPQEFTFTITFNTNAGSQVVLPDFYIFRTGHRGREVHLSGFKGSSAADVSLYNTGNDVNGTYKTKNGLPWVIEIVHPNTEYFHHPLEKINIGEAYPKFPIWAQSNGSRYVGWMLLGNKSKVYTIQ